MSFAGRRMMILVAAAAVCLPTAVATAHPAPPDGAPVPADAKAKDDPQPKAKDDPKPKAKDDPKPKAKDDPKPKAKDDPKPRAKDGAKAKDDPKPKKPGSDDPAAPPAPPAPPAPAAPVKGEKAVGHRTKGTVTVTLPGATEATPVGTTSLPLGSVVDATHGTVEVSTALPGGEMQQATFWGGRFRLTQSAKTGRVGIHMPKVSVARRCGRPAVTASAASVIATAAKKKRSKRRLNSLWVRDDHGAFTTHGRNSVATVRGTAWVTRERCDGTFTYVRKGRVDVRDRRTGRVVKLRAGHAYLARQ
jgi:hypothetical protein